LSYRRNIDDRTRWLILLPEPMDSRTYEPANVLEEDGKLKPI